MIQAVAGIRDQAGLHGAGAEDVDADDLQHVVAIGELGVDLDDRARHGDLRQARASSRIDRFVETAARAAHLEIGVAGEKLHAERELVDRGAGDERHRVAERDAERDGEHRQRAARLVLRQRAGEHGARRGEA